MDTKFLETFLLAVDTGSIAEAARRLNLTSTAAAKRIRALENEIGADLVKRSGRTVKPTPAGGAIVERAREFLTEAREFRSIAALNRPSGRLRVGATQSALIGLLPDILVLLEKRYSDIDVHITRGTSETLYRKMLDGDALDAAIMVQPPFALPKSYEWRLLRKDPLVVLTRAPAPTLKPHAILTTQPFIRLDRNTWLGHVIDGYLRRARIRPRERLEIGAMDAIAVMVDRGLGVSLLPDWAPPWPEGLSLAKLPVPNKGSGRCIGLMWPRASLRLRLVHAFLEQAAAARDCRPAQSATSSRARARR